MFFHIQHKHDPSKPFFSFVTHFNGFYTSNHYVFIQHVVCSTCFFCDVDTGGMWTYIAKPLIFCGLNFLEFFGTQPKKKQEWLPGSFPPLFWGTSWAVKNTPGWTHDWSTYPHEKWSLGLIEGTAMVALFVMRVTLHGSRLTDHDELPIYIGIILNLKHDKDIPIESTSILWKVCR